jgi:hypothetical protein
VLLAHTPFLPLLFKMLFSPVLVVACATLLSSSTSATPLAIRQSSSNSSSQVSDPHRAPDSDFPALSPTVVMLGPTPSLRLRTSSRR